MYHPRPSGVRKATIVKTRVDPTSLSRISTYAEREGVAFAPNANRVTEPGDRRSTIPDRPNPKFVQTRSVRKRVNFSPHRALEPVKPRQTGYSRIVGRVNMLVYARRLRRARTYSSGIFSILRNLARRNKAPRST